MSSKNLALIQKIEKRVCMVKFLKHGKVEPALTKLYILDITAIKKLASMKIRSGCRCYKVLEKAPLEIIKGVIF